MELVDIGVNLTHSSFRKDRKQVIDRALAAGVAQMVITGTSIDESRAAQVLAASRPGVLFATAGVHPHDARHWGVEDRNILADLAALPEVVAIGETGLDFNRNYSPPVDQEHAFIEQLELAAVLGLPVFMHERDAHQRFIELLAPRRDRLCAGVVHCFTGDAEQLAAYLQLDLHIGITGWICDERRGRQLREAVRQLPLERLMIETDAPFLLPRTLEPRPQSRRNEPQYLIQIVSTLAECMECDVAVIANGATVTARRFFGLA